MAATRKPVIPLTPPSIGALWREQHGFYAGVVRGRRGAPNCILIVSEDDRSFVKWEAAAAWAKGLAPAGDFTLPTRDELRILFANARELFATEWYWSSEEVAGVAQCAWCQGFDNGTQSSLHKFNELRARAVRRVAIQ